MESFSRFNDSQVYFTKYSLNFVNEQKILKMCIIHLQIFFFYVDSQAVTKKKRKNIKKKKINNYLKVIQILGYYLDHPKLGAGKKKICNLG